MLLAEYRAGSEGDIVTAPACSATNVEGFAMSVGRWIALVGIALLVMVLNVAASVVYMVVYGHLIDPGHDTTYYQAHIQVAAPYCGLVAGIPLMFLAGFWVGRGRDPKSAVRSAWIVWSAYALLDFAVLLAAGLTARIAVFFAASFLTRLAAVQFGAVMGSHFRRVGTDQLPLSPCHRES